jgi:orotidine-5'-phosphate decarboxylase
MKTDELFIKIIKKRCPICVGLDTLYNYIPKDFFESPMGNDPLDYAAKAISAYNAEILDAVADIVPAVKIQSACYEMYGVAGMMAFAQTIQMAKEKGLIVIADVKRNDIGSTAAAYAAAYLTGAEVQGKTGICFDADFITVNPYLGSDGIMPFVDACAITGKGIFCLVKTSNPSSGDFQDIDTGGEKLYEKVAQKVKEWGEAQTGTFGYSSIGAVVGATYPHEAEALRKKMPHTVFLIPGYGAQGATADDIAVSFDKDGLGGIVNSSRGILLAYKNDRYKNKDFTSAARQATIDMRDEILAAFDKRGIGFKERNFK